MVSDLGHALVGDGTAALLAAVKAVAMFTVAVLVFRLTERRTMAELAPFDWVAAVAVGAIVGRTATAPDASASTGAAALVALLLAHAALTRLRFLAPARRLVDPPLRVLVRDGRVDERALRRCGMTTTDLEAVLREHGHPDASEVHLAVFEAKGAVSVLARPRSGADDH